MIRLLVVDRIRLVCEIIGAALEGEPDMRVFRIATSKAEALEQLETQPESGEPAINLALINTSLPGNDTLELVKEIYQRFAGVRILVVGLPDKEAVILRYIEAGAKGYVLRADSVAELLHNIRAAVDEQALVSPSMAATLMARLADLSEKLSDLDLDTSAYEELTPREKEILDRIAGGMTNQEIADDLVIEVGTVKNHVHNILNKLNVNSRQDAAMLLTLVENQQAPGSPDRDALRQSETALKVNPE
ncbi:MAG: response regulator transcription factor [Caldilineaceae bacterium]|nr:response regulator transcription factor [Caldilineaceae bacterium]